MSHRRKSKLKTPTPAPPKCDLSLPTPEWIDESITWFGNITDERKLEFLEVLREGIWCPVSGELWYPLECPGDGLMADDKLAVPEEPGAGPEEDDLEEGEWCAECWELWYPLDRPGEGPHPGHRLTLPGPRAPGRGAPLIEEEPTQGTG